MDRLLKLLQEAQTRIAPFIQRFTEKCRQQLRVFFNYLNNHWPHYKERSYQYIRLTRMDKPIGSLLLLWPTLWALWIAAEGFPGAHLLFVFVAGTFLTRSAGCVMNDYADRHFDGHVARTQERPLATGKVSTKEAFFVAISCLFVAFLLVLTTNRITVIFAMIAIPIAVIYPYLKRFTYLPQFFLGIAFSWGIPMAFTAISGQVPVIAWLIFIANLLWTVVFDTIYAMVDREHDLKIGVKSTAILFDDADRLIIGIIQLLTIVVLIVLGNKLEFGWPFFSSIIAGAGIFTYQQYLINDRLPEKCFRAFMNNNWFGVTIFLGIVLNYSI